MRLLDTTDLYRLEQALESKQDKELDRVCAMESREARRLHNEIGLLARQREALQWLQMMQRCVHTDARVIELPGTVSVALWDSYVKIPE
jgi:hypothetical protein